MAKLFANSGDLNQMPHSAASYLSLDYLLLTLLWVSRLQWVKERGLRQRGLGIPDLFAFCQALVEESNVYNT